MFESEKLIELVKSRPSIYKSTAKDYRCKDVSSEAWNQIAEIMGKDEQQCRQVWTGLRSSYARHLQNMKKNKEGVRQRCKKPWYLAEKMAFLDKHMKLSPNNRRLYQDAKGIKGSTMTEDDSSTSHSNMEFRSENLMLEDSLSIGSIKSEIEEECELNEETNNSMKTLQNFDEETNEDTIINKEENFAKESEALDQNILPYQQNKRKNVYQSSQNLKQIKMYPSESSLNDKNKIIQSREDSILMFFQSVLLDIRSLSDRKLRMFKQDIFQTLNKYLDEEEIDD